ncbi:tudor domain-containing protein 5 [Zophobas morio]|uniref:tudor domain-containing protein 5 n=1 Tax=Zophobas morio TaxID=2755281 RepID=UPI0030833655
MAPSQESETKCIITGLLTSNPLRCTIKQLCNDFYNTTGYNIPFRKLGFSCVEEYLRSIPGTVRIIGSGPSAEVQGVVTQNSAHINIMVAKQKKDSIPAHKRKNVKVYQQPSTSNVSTNNTTKQHFHHAEYDDEYKSKIPKRIQNNLRKLIMRFPNGIWCTKLRQEYNEMFREDLNYEKFHFRSLIEMCTDLSDIFRYIQPTSEDFILYDKAKAIPSLNQNESANESSDVEQVEIDWSLGSELIPADVVQYLDEIPRFSLSDIMLGDYLDINIGEIYSIDQFWVFPKYGDIEVITNELESLFKRERNRYVVPELFLEVGLYCTVYYANKYHRCVINELLPRAPGYVKVFFIDYGSVGEVPVKDVWYLPQQFAQFPCQAISARLFKVQPNMDSNQTTFKFKELVKQAELIAEVMTVERQSTKLEIYLADVTDPGGIFYVNDALVEKGYAEYCKKEDTK